MAISELNAIMQIPDFKRYVKEVEIHYLLAELYSLTQQWKKEIEEYRIILTFVPDDVKANYRLGQTYFKQKNYSEAKNTLMRAVNNDPKLTDCYLPLGVSCYHVSDYDNSEIFLLKAVENAHNNPEANYYLGLIFKGKKDYDSAIKAFENAQKDSSLYRKSIMKIAEIYYDTANFDKAISVLETGLSSLKPREEESLEYRYLLAESFEMDNKIQEAVYHWQKVQQEHPNYRSTEIKLEEYKILLSDENLKKIFTSSLEVLQPILAEIIAKLFFNIISKSFISANEILFKAYHTKRINEPPVLILFNRTSREITENQIMKFSDMIVQDKCKMGIYITTSRFSIKAKHISDSKNVELHDKEFIIKTLEKISGKKVKKGN